MSKFLEYAKEEILASGDNFISIAEIIGNSDPETIEIRKNNPCQDVYSVAKSFTATISINIPPATMMRLAR